MIWLIAAFLSCWAAYAAADEEMVDIFADTGRSHLCISLGSNCDTVSWLKTYDLRPAAFPFDWLLTLDIAKLIELLDTDFDRFLDRAYFAPFNTAFIHSYYHIEFRHEGKYMEEIFTKYPRRIERFRQLGEYPRKVFFIRMSYAWAMSPTLYWPIERALHITLEDAVDLSEALRKLFPRLDFTLIILNHDGPEEAETFRNVFMLGGCASKDRMIQIFEALAAGNPERLLNAQ